MKQAKILITAFFVIVAAVFGVYRFRQHQTSDDIAPVIMATSDTLEVSVEEATDEKLLEGMTATDNKDGDVTDKLMVTSKSKFIEKGTLRVNYAAFDENNNVGTYQRVVSYTNYHSPRFVLTQPLKYASGSSSYNTDFMQNLSCIDVLDGDITGQVKQVFVESRYDEETEYSDLSFLVSNSAADTVALPLTARFESKEVYSLPAPALNNYIVYTKVGQPLDFASYEIGVWQNGNVTKFSEYDEDDRIVYKKKGVLEYVGSVDFNTPGVYEAIYTLTYYDENAVDDEGNPAPETITLGSVVQYIVVEE